MSFLLGNNAIMFKESQSCFLLSCRKLEISGQIMNLLKVLSSSWAKVFIFSLFSLNMVEIKGCKELDLFFLNKDSAIKISNSSYFFCMDK